MYLIEKQKAKLFPCGNTHTHIHKYEYIHIRMPYNYIYIHIYKYIYTAVAMDKHWVAHVIHISDSGKYVCVLRVCV